VEREKETQKKGEGQTQETKNPLLGAQGKRKKVVIKEKKVQKEKKLWREGKEDLEQGKESDAHRDSPAGERRYRDEVAWEKDNERTKRTKRKTEGRFKEKYNLTRKKRELR